MYAESRSLALRVRAGTVVHPATHAASYDKPSSAVRSFPERNQIRKQPVSPGHARWQLPEERQPGVHVIAFAVLRDQYAALQRRFVGVAHRQERFVRVLVPTARK